VLTPKKARSTDPLAFSWGTTRLAVSIGTANASRQSPRPPTRGGDLGVDANHTPARVHQRAARVAGVDRGIGLDHAVDGEPVGRAELALEGGDDATGHGVLEPEGVSQGEDRVTDLDVPRDPERDRSQVGPSRIDPEHGQVGGEVASDHLGVDQRALVYAHPNTPRVLHDVGVGQHEALPVEDEARSRGHASALGRTEGRAPLTDHLGLDEDDPRGWPRGRSR
jgi:hypothetical protein